MGGGMKKYLKLMLVFVVLSIIPLFFIGSSHSAQQAWQAQEEYIDQQNIQLPSKPNMDNPYQVASEGFETASRNSDSIVPKILLAVSKVLEGIRGVKNRKAQAD